MHHTNIVASNILQSILLVLLLSSLVKLSTAILLLLVILLCAQFKTIHNSKWPPSMAYEKQHNFAIHRAARSFAACS